VPTGRKIRPTGHKIYQLISLEDPPKFTQIGFENVPSGNPVNVFLFLSVCLSQFSRVVSWDESVYSKANKKTLAL
jgi:hypothetical protein